MATAFGFCEFACPDAGLRAIRLLHDYELGGKRLVARVDAKTKTVLDEYKEKRKKLRGRSPLQDEKADDEDYMDDAMKESDKVCCCICLEQCFSKCVPRNPGVP